MNKNIIKVLSAIPITIVHHITYLFDLSNKSPTPVAEMFLQCLFSGNPDRQHDNFIMTIVGLFEILIFNLIFGTFLYNDLNSGSIYIIIRQKSRLKWYLSKSFQLFFFSAFYVIGYLSSVFFLCVFSSAHSIDDTAISIYLISLIILTLFTFLTTLLINQYSIRFGSNFGFVIVYSFISILTGLAIANEKIPLLKNMPFLLRLNPMVNVVINWGLIGQKTIFSIVYLLTLVTFIIFDGFMFVSKLDIGIRDPENNQ